MMEIVLSYIHVDLWSVRKELILPDTLAEEAIYSVPCIAFPPSPF